MNIKVKGLLGAVALVASLLAAFPVLSTSAATCAAPTLLEGMVSQGLPHNGTDISGKPNPPLVRGKSALVKLFFGVPVGVSAIQVLPTSYLKVLNGTTTVSTGNIPMTGVTAPIVSQTKLDDSAADPKFNVPGTVLAPSSTTDAWQATFRAHIDFTTTSIGQCTSSKDYDVIAQVARKTGALRVLVLPIGDETAPTPQFTKAPLPGDTSSALQAVQDGFVALSRILPVPDNVADLDLTTSSAGIRWHLNDGMVPLTNLGIRKDLDGKYCLNDQNFAKIASSLDTFLQAWNSAQPTVNTTADRVLGVIDSEISHGIEKPGCWEGAAQIGSVHAWARAIHDTADNAETRRDTGPVMAMELKHTAGLKVPTTLGGNGDSTYHAAKSEADLTNPKRGYNILTNSYIENPRSVMKLSTPFTNHNTLADQTDWADMLCSLGGPTTPRCGGTSTKVVTGLGSTAAVGASAQTRFYLSAISDGSPENAPNAFGTQITDSYYTSTRFETPDDPSSEFHFAAYDSNGSTIVDKQVTLETRTSEHLEDQDSLLPSRCPFPYTTSVCGTFAFAVAVPSQPASFEIWKGVPKAAGSTMLVRRTTDVKPTVTSVNVTNEVVAAPVNLTNDGTAHETDPAITPDGKWLLYTRTPIAPTQVPCTELVARPINANGTLGTTTYYLPGGDTLDTTKPGAGNICHSGMPRQGAWRGDGRAGAFVRDGELHVFDFSPTSGFTNITVVLACAGTSSLGACLSESPQELSNIANPSWSPDADWRASVTNAAGYRLSFDADSLIGGQRDLYFMDPYSPLITLANGRKVHPATLVARRAVDGSWGHAAGKGKTLVYTDLAVSTGSPIRVIDVGNTALPTTGIQISCCGRRGSFGDRFIAIEEEDPGTGTPTGNISLLDYHAGNVTPVPDQKTSSGRDTSPDITATLVANQPFSQLLVFDRQDATHEIYLYNLNTGDRRTVTVAGTVGTPNVEYASSAVFVQCNGVANPYVTVLKPVWTRDLGNGLTAVRFRTSLNHAEVCGNPDPSSPVADAPRAGATIDDQSLISDLVYGGGVGTTPKPPSASIVYTTGTAIPSQNLNLVGSAVDPWSLTDVTKRWKVYAPNGSLYAERTGEVAVVPVPASGFFTPGTWKLEFTVTNRFGLSDTDTKAVRMQVPTPPATSTDFDPNSLIVPIDPTGSPNVTVYITVAGRDLGKIPKSSVAITSIDGVDVSGEPSLLANGWSPNGTTATATFDKTAVTTKIYSIGGSFPRRVRITITGTSGAAADAFGFSATDAGAPCAHLQNQGSTC